MSTCVKEECTERLILTGRADAPNGEAGHKRHDLILAELSGMTLAVKDDESRNASDGICLAALLMDVSNTANGMEARFDFVVQV